MKIFYHSADLDGQCSGAILYNKYPNAELIGVDYGNDAIVEESINDGEIVYIVDYSLQPFKRMIDLSKKCKIFWIDHHLTAIKESQKYNPDFDSFLRIGIGACALVWEYLYNKVPLPYSIKLLSEYDVWNHTDNNTLPFQYGIRMEDTSPDSKLWNKLFNHNDMAIIDSIVKDGNLLLKYEQIQNEKFCKSFSFYSEFEGYRAIVVNKGFTNSKVFDSVDKSTYDIMISFCWRNNMWTVSLYSEVVNVGEIAEKYGGGGHQGAAGFRCDKLPFLRSLSNGISEN